MDTPITLPATPADMAKTLGYKRVTGGLAPWQVRRLDSYIDANLHSALTIGELAGIARLSRSHFSRAFRDSFGNPPHQYIIRRRLQRAKGLLLSTAEPIVKIAAECGLSDQAHLTKLFRKIVGESPAHWRRMRMNPPN
jgi:AraC family transcriptional regulator